MANVYFFLFTKNAVEKDGVKTPGFTKEQAIKKINDDGIVYVQMIENDDVTLFTVKEKPADEETTLLVMITPTMFALLEDLGEDEDEDEKTTENLPPPPVSSPQCHLKPLSSETQASIPDFVLE